MDELLKDKKQSDCGVGVIWHKKSHDARQKVWLGFNSVPLYIIPSMLTRRQNSKWLPLEGLISRFEQQVAIITGAANGIGFYCAQIVARHMVERGIAGHQLVIDGGQLPF